MSENNMLFKFDSVNIPEFRELANKKTGYYEYGLNNQYPKYLQDLYKKSSTHNSIVNNIIQRVVGTGFQSENPTMQARIDKYKVNEWFNGVAKDAVLYGGFATELIYTSLHEYVNSFYHCPVDRLRVGLFGENEESDLYYYSMYFNDYTYQSRNKEISVIRKFDLDPKSDNHQILYNYGVNRVGSDVYPRPTYSSSVPWIETDLQLPVYYMNLVHNSFQVNNILVVPYQPNEDARAKFENGLKEKFTGTENGGSTMVIYAPSDAAKVELLPLSGENGEKKYDELVNLVVESLSRGNGLPSPMLAGLSVAGNLFGIADLPQLEVMFNKQRIYPLRNMILNDFQKFNVLLREPIENFTIQDINIFNEKTQ